MAFSDEMSDDESDSVKVGFIDDFSDG